MKVKQWLIIWLVTVTAVLSILGYGVYRVDPYFHYHKPDLDKYFYVLDNQRSQNDGIIRHFEYDAMITGTSMTENFRTTEADKIFGCSSIKVPFFGGSYKEINDNIANALKVNDKLKIVIRGLDMGRFCDPPDIMRFDLGEYPTYLYDDDPFNDVEYLLNRDVVFGRVCKMILAGMREGSVPGITSFDDYSSWQFAHTFGINTVCPEGLTVTDSPQSHLTDEEKEMISQNIDLNVTAVADEYPNVDFYYFYTPYSIAKWGEWKSQGILDKMLEAEAIITERIVSHKNIHLFSFNNRTDITSDLNNYMDGSHYAIWINSLILKWMHDGECQITEDNYKDYLKQEYEFYTTFDYAGVNGQEDYEADYYAAALLNKELTGAEPLALMSEDSNGGEFSVNLDKGYNYLCFKGRKITEQGYLAVYVLDEDGEVVGKAEADSPDLDDNIHQYAIDLSAVSGNVTVVLKGEGAEYAEGSGPDYRISDVFMY